MIKGTLIAIMSWLIVLIIVAGCMGDFKSRTVIIPDDQFVSDAGEGSGEFEVNKIYKMSNQEHRTSDILGWLDNEQILVAFEEQGHKISLEQMDYQYQSRQPLSKMEEYIQVSDLSPDGSWISLVTQEEGLQRIKLINVLNLKETIIEEKASAPLETGLLLWSNNSRYISYVKWNSDNRSTSINVYDVALSIKHEYALLNRQGGSLISQAKISDDGEHALIIEQRKEQAYMMLGSLTTNGFASVFEHTVSNSYNYDYMNDDQIAFIGQDSDLILFDRRNESSTVLLERIDTFALSRDRKSIAYSKERDTIYAAVIQGNSVMNMKLIYKGLFSYRIRWSDDNRKILINGRKSYITEPYYDIDYMDPIPVIVPMVVPMELNNDSLIIEMK
jgi:Tol biopolymer transport system component